jgi:SPP1 gp7 family putative phage head morphogenesis protein
LFQKSIGDLELEEFLQERRDLTLQTVSIYERGIRLGFDSVNIELGLGIGFNINSPEILQFLTEKPIKIGRVVNTVRNQIRMELIAGATANETIEQIATRIKKLITGAMHRAMTIAQTEIGSAMNYSRSLQLRDSGFMKKKWFTAMDERVRISHRQMHGQSIDVNGVWIVDGASLRFPGDPAGPAREIINCRCIEIADKSSRI